jgi:hypothetical protein
VLQVQGNATREGVRRTSSKLWEEGSRRHLRR